MTPEQLKASILQYAIQGKLVEQRAEEGTGEELYQQIQEEKQKLVKEGKIKKEKLLPEISEDEVPFEIPENWKWVRLGNVLKEVVVPQRDKPRFSSNGIPWCRIEDRDGYWLNGSKSNQLVSQDTIAQMNLKVLPVGTVLSACTGGSIGTIVINTVECCTNQTFNGLICSSGLVNWYLVWYLTSKFTELRSSGSGTTIPYVSQQKTKEMIFPLPPLAEQRRIVAKIEELLPIIDRYAIAYEKLEKVNSKFPKDMKNSILQYAIQGKLVEQRKEEGTAEELYQQMHEEKQRLIKEGKIKKEKPLPEIAEEEIPFDIPENWKWVRWGDLSFSIQYGYNAPAKNNGRIRMVRISDIQNGEVAWDSVPFCDIKEDEIQTYLLAKNDILFARTGGTVGKSYIVKETPEDAIYAGYLIRTRYSDMLCPEYLYYFMQTQLYWNQLRNGTIATAQPNCNGQTLSKMILPLPPLVEQKRIVAKIEELLPFCNRLVK